jgi:5-methylcytosine-specific restriction endonuclease McrA
MELNVNLGVARLAIGAALVSQNWRQEMERPNIQKDVFARDGFKCVYCDFDGTTFEGWLFLQVDHFIPRRKGGTDELSNLVTACVTCNAEKRAQVFSSLAEARANLQAERASWREHWEKNIKPLV